MTIRATAAIVASAALAGLVASGPAAALGGKATAELKDRDGKAVGTVQIMETAAGSLVKVVVKGLTPGPHGLHVHETGKCDGDFMSAGEIYNPLGSKHGFLSDEGPMAGDLPNLHVGAGGELEVEFINQFLTLSKDGEETMFDADGTALVVFEKGDDYLTDGDGNSGTRIACGALVSGK